MSARFFPASRPAYRVALALAVSLVIVGLALPYLLIDDEPESLRDNVSSGSVARLSAGTTYYELAGPSDGPLVVLVHGTTIPSFVWDHNFGALARAGRRAVRYDLYGRGLSARPHGRYDLDLHVNQLAELVALVSPGRSVDLVGLSMGAIVASEFTLRHPGQVSKLVLIGPAGVGTELPFLARVAMAPGVGEYLMRVAGTRQLAPAGRNLLHPDRHPDFDARYLSTIRVAGSRRAVLESLRRMPLDDYGAGYARLGALGKPILLVWGREDRVVPFSHSQRLRRMVRPAAFVAVEDAGHLPHYERPELVNHALLRFLADAATISRPPPEGV